MPVNLPKAALFSALSALFVIGSPSDSEANFLERLFNPESRRKKVVIKQRRPAPVKVKKIRAPTYYTYKPVALQASKLDRLARTDFNKVELAPAEGARRFERSRFLSALGHLSDFSPAAEKNLSKAVLDHYRKDPTFIWIKNYRVKPETQAVMEVLGDAESYGLVSAEYAVSAPESAGLTSADEMRALVRFELTMSLRTLRYALDAREGRINPNRLSAYHDFKGKGSKADKILMSLSSSDDPAGYLLSLHPQNETFKTMRRELAVVRNAKKRSDLVIVPEKTFVKPGRTHDSMPIINRGMRKFGSDAFMREFGPLLSVNAGNKKYTPELVTAVKAFQKENKLKPDGIIGRMTIAKLSDKEPKDRLQSVLSAMERLRWHPSDFGNRYVMINQPAYRASYYSGGTEKLSMRVVIGKRSNQTNFFHDEIETVVYNPYWGVPRSILVNEMLPKLRKDPSYFDRKGYELTTVRGKQISSSSVDWYSVGSNFGYNVRQYPGKSNALGELKILFPNRHNIYMHDTPARSLFSRDRRAYSHGCVRLHKPREMAAAVLGTDLSYIRSRLAKGHNKQKLKTKMPVYIAYFTAWPDKDGKVQYFNDVYGRDKHLKKAMDKTAKARAAQS
ncbi:MAG: L,D-transpeptidase family protein [Pseudomonadota bacterium]